MKIPPDPPFNGTIFVAFVSVLASLAALLAFVLPLTGVFQ